MTRAACLMAAILSMSRCFFVSPWTMLLSMPCILPTAGARISTPVLSTNCFASSGVESPFGQVGRRFVNFRAGSNVPDFSLYKHGRIDRFQRFDGLLGLAHIFFEGQGRQIKDNGVESGFCSLHPFREGVRMIRVQKNGEAEFLTQASHESRDLASSHKLTLALGQTDQDRHVSSRAAAKTAFNKTRSEILKWPIATPVCCDSCRRSRNERMWLDPPLLDVQHGYKASSLS